MNGQSINSGLKYLAELIEDFPPKKKITATNAFEELKVRYETLESYIDGFLDFLSDLPKSKIKQIFPDMIEGEDYFPNGMKLFMAIAHTYLFTDILGNAGQFRLKTDPHNGSVYYGGLNNREIGKYKFYGSNPGVILDDLNIAFSFLQRKSNEPIKSGLEFYRRFVRIHPFYEANGRIARLILTIYLQYHGYYIVWRDIDNKCKGRFLSKLNSCHTHEGKATYEKYFGYFVDFFEPFIKPISELNKF